MIRFFRHYVPASMLLLLVVEFFLLGFAGHFALTHYPQPTPPASLVLHAETFRPWLFAASMALLMSLFGLYDWEWTRGLRSLTLRLGGSLALGLLLLQLTAGLLPGLFADGPELLVAMLIAALGVLLGRLIFMQWGNVELFKKRLLVLGSGSRSAKIEEIFACGQAMGLHLVGYLPMGSSHHFVPRERVLDESGSLRDIVERYKVDEIVVAVRERRGGGLPVSELLECKLHGIHILDLPAFFERQTGILPLESINASWMIFAEGFHQGTLRDVVKRLFDLLVSSLLLLATLPIILVTALAIKLESHGPIFYTQERIGQSGRPFTIYKFRSMFIDAEKDGLPRWAQMNDDRTTRVGRIIRRTRIDELPQLINVFLGHMSFVGPRPERPYFVADLSTQIPYYNTRHSVKPGITGWAQVRFPYGASVEDAMGKLQYDLYYVKNHSLFLDLMILLQTAQVVVLGKGAR